MTFPLPHHVIEEKKEVWIVVTSAITALGISPLMEKYFPGYSPRLCSQAFFDKLNKLNGETD